MRQFFTLCKQQLEFLGPLRRVEIHILRDLFDSAIKKSDQTQSMMNPAHQHLDYFHTARSVVFLYQLSRVIYLSDTSDKNNLSLAEKLFLLNRHLNSIDLFFKIEMLMSFLQ